MASCAIWFCYSNGHWAKGKAALLNVSGHWVHAKAIWWHDSHRFVNRCITTKPTVGRASSPIGTLGGAVTIRATATKYDTLTWQYRQNTSFPWVTSNQHSFTYIVKGLRLASSGYLFRLTATNAFGTTYGNPGIIKVLAPVPVFTLQPMDIYGTETAKYYNFFRATKYSTIIWYRRSSSGLNWVALTNSTPYTIISDSGRTITTGSISAHSQGMQYKVRLTNATGQYVDSRITTVHMGIHDPRHLLRYAYISSRGVVNMSFIAAVTIPGSNWASQLMLLKNGIPAAAKFTSPSFHTHSVQFHVAGADGNANWAIYIKPGFFGIMNAGIYPLVPHG